MGTAPQKNVRILVADDDPVFGATLKRVLESDGHACELVADGPSAMEALQRTNFDLLIADIDMPGNRGLEMVQALSGLPERPPIILLTGSPSLATATKSVGLAVFAYLTKPFDVAELRRTIGDALANGRVRRAIIESEHRVRTWSEDMARIRELLQRVPDATLGAQSYLALTLNNLVSALGDFADVAGVMARSDAHRKHVESAALVKALEETISVLESTRHKFKSKELGSLRRKLEELLREPGAETADEPSS